MKKKLWLAALMALLCCMLFAIGADAATEGAYTYTVTDGKATITAVSNDLYLNGDVVVPSTLGGYPVTAIGDDAFPFGSRCVALTLPEGLVSIGKEAFSYSSFTSIALPSTLSSIGEAAFYGSDYLTAFTVAAGNTHFTAVDGVLFSKDKTVLICYPGGKSDTSYTVPDGVKRIEVCAFAWTLYLKNVTLPSSVVTIEAEAFQGSIMLECISMPGVVTIGDYAFADCPLKSLTIPAGIDSLGEGAFFGCTALKELTIEEGVTTVGDFAFNNCTSLESVVIPASITSMGTGMFSHCSSLEEVTLAPGLTTLGYGMFSNCTALEEVTVPDSVMSIGGYAFQKCSSLQSVTIPDSVTSLGEKLFDGMSGVTAYVGEGSAAEAYMKDANIDYETVAQTPAILVQAQSVRAKVGETAALFVVSSVKDGILTYQWYVSDNAEGPFTPIPGATQAAYVPDTSAAGVKFYYVSVTNTNDNATGTKTAVTQSAMSSVTVGQVSGCTVSGKLFTSGDASDVTIELLLNGKVEYTCTVEDTTGEAQYAIEGVTPGIYTMRVSKEKHVTREYTVTVQP